jgi:hypothetical protein
VSNEAQPARRIVAGVSVFMLVVMFVLAFHRITPPSCLSGVEPAWTTNLSAIGRLPGKAVLLPQADLLLQTIFAPSLRWGVPSDVHRQVFRQLLMFPSAHSEPANVGGLYEFVCGGAMRVPGVMMTSPVDLRQISYTRSGSRRM